MTFQIEITSKIKSPEDNLPSQFQVGAGSDRGTFKVTGNPMPSEGELAAFMWGEIVDFMIMEYNAETGEGDFVVVDDYAPAAGTVYIYDGR